MIMLVPHYSIPDGPPFPPFPLCGGLDRSKQGRGKGTPCNAQGLRLETKTVTLTLMLHGPRMHGSVPLINSPSLKYTPVIEVRTCC